MSATASASPRDWRAGLALGALAVIGQAAALTLIDAPPYAVYQHYRPWGALVAGPAPGLIVLALQAAICLALAAKRRASLAASLARAGWGWLLLATVAVAFWAAVPTESIGRVAGEIVLAITVMAVATLNLVLAVQALPEAALRAARARLAAALTLDAGDSPTRPWDAWLPYAAAAWVLAVSSLMAAFVWERVPHIDDSIAYLFQAKYLATGVLWLPRPPDPDSFGVAHLLVDGDKWYGKFFVGWPMLLAIGERLGVPWLVSPLLGAASLPLAHRLMRRLYDLRTAHAVVLLLAVSPWLLATSASFMSHAASLFWMLLAAVTIDRQRGRRLGWPALVAGIALGMLFLTRPFDAVLVGPVLGAWALGLGGTRLRLPSLVAIGGVAALLASLYFAYNRAVTGDLLTAPHRLWSDRVLGPGRDRFGFGADIDAPLWRNMDPLPGHGPADVVLHTNKSLFLVNWELFGWAVGSLLLPLVALRRGAFGRRDLLMFGLVCLGPLGHVLYWAPGGPDLGARYWYLLIVPFAFFTVRGAEQAATRFGVARERVVAAMVLATVAAALTFVPWRLATKYYRYRDIGGEIRELAAARGIEHGLVFVRSSRRSDYQQAVNLNPRTLSDAGTIYVSDLGDPHRAAVVAGLPDRPVWVIARIPDDAPALSVVAGPLPPGTVPSGPAPRPPFSMQVVLR